MPESKTEKIRATQNSFPAQNAGAVAECPLKAKAIEEKQEPVFAKTMTNAPKPAPELISEARETKKEKKDWIEIMLVDLEGNPVPNVRYRITPPGGDPPQEGTLNEHGQAGYYKIESGECKVEFPDLDKDAWK